MKHQPWLSQGEVLGDVYEHRANYMAGSPPEGGLKSTTITSIQHPYMVVLHPACDLEQDFKRVRFTNGEISEPQTYQDNESPYTVPHVLLCDAYEYTIVRQRFIGQTTLWEQVRGNKHQRYHVLKPSRIEDGGTKLPELYLDFKKTLGLPTVSLYEAIRLKKVKRIGIVKPIYLHDLIQRFYSFLSRIGLPEEEKKNQPN